MSIFFPYAFATKFDLDVNWVKVKAGIIYTNYDGTKTPKLHTKFQGPMIPGKMVFEVFLPYMGMAAILVM